LARMHGAEAAALTHRDELVASAGAFDEARRVRLPFPRPRVDAGAGGHRRQRPHPAVAGGGGSAPPVLFDPCLPGVARAPSWAAALGGPPARPGRARAVGDPAPPPRRAAAGGRAGQAAAYSTLTRSSGGLSRPKPSCSTRTASSAYLRSITTEMRISEVEIMM